MTRSNRLEGIRFVGALLNQIGRKTEKLNQGIDKADALQLTAQRGAMFLCDFDVFFGPGFNGELIGLIELAYDLGG